jgi:hypothetical protein
MDISASSEETLQSKPQAEDSAVNAKAAEDSENEGDDSVEGETDSEEKNEESDCESVQSDSENEESENTDSSNKSKPVDGESKTETKEKSSRNILQRSKSKDQQQPPQLDKRKRESSFSVVTDKITDSAFAFWKVLTPKRKDFKKELEKVNKEALKDEEHKGGDVQSKADTESKDEEVKSEVDNSASSTPEEPHSTPSIDTATEVKDGKGEEGVAKEGATVEEAAEEKQAVKVQEHRQQIAQEIYDTECAYVNSLELLMKIFLKPLREKQIITEQQTRRIASETETILNFQKVFLSELEPLIANWTADSMLGELFINMVTSLYS